VRSRSRRCDGDAGRRAPAAVLTEELVTTVFGLPCQIIDDPQTGTPLVVPAARTRARGEEGAGYSRVRLGG
jgi:hypothetical protein